MKTGFCRASRLVLALSLPLAAGLALGVQSAWAAFCTLAGAVEYTNDDQTTNWNDGANWSTNSVPNSPTTNVCDVDPVGDLSVFEINPSVASLQIASGNSVFVAGNTLSVYGPSILNSGDLIISFNVGDDGVLGIKGQRYSVGRRNRLDG
jgi:hypothetical protein